MFGDLPGSLRPRHALGRHPAPPRQPPVADHAHLSLSPVCRSPCEEPQELACHSPPAASSRISALHFLAES
eukprot:425001-Amorphochlora_amoeboformis.AAC.1